MNKFSVQNCEKCAIRRFVILQELPKIKNIKNLVEFFQKSKFQETYY